MSKLVLLCALICLSSAAFAADESNPIIDAAKKLSDSPNYSWRAFTQDSSNGGTTISQEGKTEKDGFTLLSFSSGDYFVRVALKGGKGLVNIGEGWKSADDLADQRRTARFVTRIVGGFKSPAALAQQLATLTKNLKQDGETYIAQLIGNDANEVNAPLSSFRGGGGGREMTNAKATVTFWIRDGVLEKLQVRSTGTISRGGNDMNVDRTTTVEFRDVGNTKVELPEDLKKKLQ